MSVKSKNIKTKNKINTKNALDSKKNTLNNFSQNKNKFYHNNIVIYLLFITIITWVVLSPNLKNSFTNWDDPVYVYENNYIKNLSKENIKQIFSNIIAYNYHPLTILSLSIDYKFAKKPSNDFFGVDPYIFHRTNLIIHVLNTLLVFILFYLLSKKNKTVAIIVALCFGIHPMHVESVSWISARKDVMYGFFFISGLITWFKYNDKGSKSIGLYTVTFLLFILSILSKPAAAAFAPVLFLFDYFQKRKISLKLFIEKIPFFIAAFTIIYITFKAQSTESVGDWQAATFWERIMFASYGFIAYIVKFFVPVKLSAFYPYPVSTFPIKETLHWTFYAAPFAVLFIFALMYYCYKKQQRLPVFSILFYFFTIVMVLQFVSIGTALMAERYSYIPYLGISFLFADGFNSLLLKYKDKKFSYIRYISVTALVIYFLIIGITAFNRTKVWKNNYTLWTDVIQKHHNKVEVAFKNRGNYFARETQEFDKALRDYNTYLQLRPDDPTVYSNRGNLFGLQGKFDLAINDYSKAIVLDSNYVDAYVNRGITYMKMNKPSLALNDFNYAVKLTPGNLTNLRNRAYCFVQLNKYDSAISDYSYVIAKDPTNANDFFYRAIAYFQLKDYEKSIQDNTKAISLNPQMGEAFLNRAISYQNTGEYCNAYQDILKAKQLNQNINDKLTDNLKMLCYKQKQ